jgi:hypothetical protein
MPADANAPASRLGWAWVLLCLATGAHVADEALTGFLSVYNPTVLVMRARIPWWPMPTFAFRDWLAGLMVAVAIGLALSPLAFRNLRGFRLVAYFFAVMMLLNGLGHTLGTIAGRTVAEVRFPRPMPGFYSSPLLLAASIHLLVQLRRSAAPSR